MSSEPAPALPPASSRGQGCIPTLFGGAPYGGSRLLLRPLTVDPGAHIPPGIERGATAGIEPAMTPMGQGQIGFARAVQYAPHLCII